MNNIIGIYDGCDECYDENSLEQGIGGSESWVIYISEAFAKIPNTHVFVYCNCNYHRHKDYINIEFRPHEYFFQSNLKYDALIISRILTNNLVNKLKHSECCNNIYLMAHDTILRKDNVLYENYYESIITYEDFIKDNFLLKNIKKIFALSKWHKEHLMLKSHFPSNFIELTSHGYDKRLLNVTNNKERDNNIFWSNSIDRNFDLLVDYIAPKIINIIPDFKIYYSFYGEFNENYKDLLNRDYVINLGKLGKTELYNEMIKHKCSFYPTIFNETFCISCLEQALCDVQLIMPLRFGPATIFEPYKYFFMDENIWFKTGDQINQTTNKIINAIKTYDDEDKILLRKSIKNYLINKYNWDDIALDLCKKMMIIS